MHHTNRNELKVRGRSELSAAVAVLVAGAIWLGGRAFAQAEATPATQPAAAVSTAVDPAAGPLQFTMQDIDGNPVNLADHKGKVVLIVNVASKCGHTKQYAGLEALYRKYKDQGFVILGFPANNFGGQEPGTDEEIKAFCTSKYDVTFPMFHKISVKGDDQHPLYKFLTDKATAGEHAGDIKWNFTKFLIRRDGTIGARFATNITPDNPELVGKIESELNAKP